MKQECTKQAEYIMEKARREIQMVKQQQELNVASAMKNSEDKDDLLRNLNQEKDRLLSDRLASEVFVEAMQNQGRELEKNMQDMQSEARRLLQAKDEEIVYIKRTYEERFQSKCE